jgi:EAL domain-containing protein (putative c-di-GMP-specific phosphodiesterase class I)
VVAEGVEQPEQIELLRELGCDELQGFPLGRPSPAEDLEARLDAQR